MDLDTSMAYLNNELLKMVKKKLLRIGLRYANSLSQLLHCLYRFLEKSCLISCWLLQLGNPWEIVRNDVSYPIKFYGKVVSGSDGKRHWIGGEDIDAVAYDVPIPGYKTKTTINLRLWSTKASSQDFDLYAFNSGEHTKASEALANAEKVCTLCRAPFLFLFYFLFQFPSSLHQTGLSVCSWFHKCFLKWIWLSPPLHFVDLISKYRFRVLSVSSSFSFTSSPVRRMLPAFFKRSDLYYIFVPRGTLYLLGIFLVTSNCLLSNVVFVMLLLCPHIIELVSSILFNG